MSKIITGLSDLYYRLYSSEEAVNLANAVDVDVSINTSESIQFYDVNNNIQIAPGQFVSGAMNLTSDEWETSVLYSILGHSTDSSTNFTDYLIGDTPNQCAVGFVVRYQVNGSTAWVPVVFPQVLFDEKSLAAATQTDTIDFQPCSITSTVYADSNTGMWKRTGQYWSTRASARNHLIDMLESL